MFMQLFCFQCQIFVYRGHSCFYTDMEDICVLDAISRETRTFAYQAIGILAQRMPQLFR